MMAKLETIETKSYQMHRKNMTSTTEETSWLTNKFTKTTNIQEFREKNITPK